MDEINDELLNKFLDKELEQADVLRIEKAISNSEDLRKRYQALKAVHHNLMKMKAEETSPEFLNQVMSKLKKRGYNFKQQNYFLAAMYLVFMGGAIALVGYIMYGIFSTSAGSGNTSGVIDSTLHQFSNMTLSIKNFFNHTNISLIGSILAFTIIISGYLLFESFKNSKTNLNKI
jgi:anti-sigma factor RsiW